MGKCLFCQYILMLFLRSLIQEHNPFLKFAFATDLEILIKVMFFRCIPFEKPHPLWLILMITSFCFLWLLPEPSSFPLSMLPGYTQLPASCSCPRDPRSPHRGNVISCLHHWLPHDSWGLKFSRAWCSYISAFLTSPFTWPQPSPPTHMPISQKGHTRLHCDNNITKLTTAGNKRVISVLIKFSVNRSP